MTGDGFSGFISDFLTQIWELFSSGTRFPEIYIIICSVHDHAGFYSSLPLYLSIASFTDSSFSNVIVALPLNWCGLSFFLNKLMHGFFVCWSI
jgi:hypothetical protein